MSNDTQRGCEGGADEDWREDVLVEDRLDENSLSEEIKALPEHEARPFDTVLLLT